MAKKNPSLAAVQPGSWYTHAVMYQIYPRSFQDSNDDGIGDLNGIIQRLDYLKDTLGVDGIWLSPFYTSPMADFGYDISNYCEVDPIFGTLQDFDRLLTEAHQRGLKIIIDYVPNHSSDQHAWFKESRSSRDNPKRDWYIWHDAKPDGSPPNNWLSVFGGSAWEWDETTKQFYLHSFLAEQPDLNWENPEVRLAMGNVLRFWMDRGIDGFRMDAVNWLGKDVNLTDDPLNPAYKTGDYAYRALDHVYSRDAGRIKDYLNSVLNVVAEYPERLVVMEAWFYNRQAPQQYWNYYQMFQHAFSAPLNLEFLHMDYIAKDFQCYIDAFLAGLRPQDMPVHVLSNHDLPRFATKVGQAEARVGAVMLLTLPGLAFIYNGDELGMENVPIPPEKMQDPHRKSGLEYCRDPERTPMQWSPTLCAGFSTAEPWLPVSDKYKEINVEVQLKDPGSMLALYQQLIRLRKSNPVLHKGTYKPGPSIHPEVVSFYRSLPDTKWLIILNFGENRIPVADIQNTASLILSTNQQTTLPNEAFRPFEARIVSLQ